MAGEDPRSGRWQGFDKTECGLHVPDSDAETQVASIAD
jgi:phosphoadenosine phosphosulfate reductase